MKAAYVEDKSITAPLAARIFDARLWRPDRPLRIVMIGTDFEVPMDWSRLDEAVDKAVHRVPVLETAKIAGGWAGLRPLTPDDHAIIGWAPGVEGFFLAVGFGGHGFQHSPATGRHVADWIVDGKPSMDLSLFDPARFATGRADAHDKGPDAE